MINNFVPIKNGSKCLFVCKSCSYIFGETKRLVNLCPRCKNPFVKPSKLICS